MRGSYEVIGSDCRVGKGGGTADSESKAYRAPCPRVLAPSASLQDAWARRTIDLLWGGAVPAPLPTLQRSNVRIHASVLRELSVALGQQCIERARRLALGPFRAARSRGLVPGVDVAVQPRLGGGHEAAQKHRRRDRACKAAARHVIDVGDLRLEQLVVRPPQR